MTKRLYYTDSYNTSFQATIIERLKCGDQQAVILDRTYFYPESGGQPSDAGYLNQAQVVNVLIREDDNSILHLLNDDLEGDEVDGVIDWPRRFDHMQHHTGQHVLSQAFIELFGFETVGFHMGDDSCTIDLATSSLTELEINSAELLANQIVWDDRSVRISTINRHHAERLSLRKIPEIANESMRLVEIEDFDLVACGGTHVNKTGEIGQIKIIKHYKQRGKQRIEFLCGLRALNDYQLKSNLIQQLMLELTTAAPEIPDTIIRMQTELKDQKRRLKKLGGQLAELEADRLLAKPIKVNGLNVVSQVYENRDIAEIRMLINRVIRKPATIALFGSIGEKLQLIFASSEDVSLSMMWLLETVMKEQGGFSGGGDVHFAQAGSERTGKDRLEKAIMSAISTLTNHV